MTEEEMMHALSLLTPPVDRQQSRLDELRYALASTGSTDEQIEAVETAIVRHVVAFGRNPEQIADDLLMAFQAIHSFQQAMAAIKEMVPIAAQALVETSQALTCLAEAIGEPAPKPTEKTPYYQKNKQKWWK